MLKEIKHKNFKNGIVYALETIDKFPIEVTDTFLPYYTKDAINENQNKLKDYYLADRSERWMIGVSCMSGCPIGCKFCATGQLKKCRNLSTDEIIEQVDFIISKNKLNPMVSKEFKINYTRMGEPFLNIDNVKMAIDYLERLYPNKIHHYISTIGIKDSDFSWIEKNITLQISVHALNDEKRNWLIPANNKMLLKELGAIRTQSYLKTTINLTLVDERDFDINILKEYFDPKYFFVKLSPINRNEISNNNRLKGGVIKGINLI